MDAKNLEVLRKLKESMAAVGSSRPTKEADPEDSARWLLAELKSAFEPQRKRSSSTKRPAVDRPSIAKGAASKRTRPKTPWPDEAAPESQKTKRKAQEPAIWITKVCRFCKAEFTANLNWPNQPVMCSGCRNQRKVRIHTSSDSTSVPYAVIQVFGGGSPGSGKKK